ncbi:hypothetical protein NEOLEDRAFT_1239734 [Neolentinus lepideus HHB14362 ss-1]|uniref:Uncharacterized protein n=1 Tax=Neolentinus lepideus HHB14362 ss-1 TaxID=1314782 RepID=A0A165UCJ9_9AGAM|nr:hypothetical protein NEOLEDRAFT_1239734 [Neolentinus lepideus HHB14362 ss-1]
MATINEPWGVENPSDDQFPESYARTRMPEELPPQRHVQPNAQVAQSNARDTVSVRNVFKAQKAVLPSDCVAGSSGHRAQDHRSDVSPGLEYRTKKRKIDEMKAPLEDSRPITRVAKKRRNGPRLTRKKQHRAAQKAVNVTADLVAVDDDDDKTVDLVTEEPATPSRPEMEAVKPSRLPTQKNAAAEAAFPAVQDGSPAHALKVDRPSVAAASGSSTAVSVSGTETTAVASKSRRARRRLAGKVHNAQSTTEWVHELKAPLALETIEEVPEFAEPERSKKGKRTPNVKNKDATKASAEGSACTKEDLDADPPTRRAVKAAEAEIAKSEEEKEIPPAVKPALERSQRTRQRSRKAIEAAESAAHEAKRRSGRKKTTTTADESSK